ncbi:restriction endonuclease subunit S [Helicobacter pylori]|uniref:restriction endonuclease subunit S n=1 Tax=Helicobacter pylori TaxID=210 RepID=UPI001ABA3D3D|nr:restriction endonuclease subunit S [Helicobacter pylori]WRE16211.1 restriction endonuclease subunit S [Helicobacter pylori]
MIGPLSSQLNAIKWGEFKLGDLFEKLDLKFKKKTFNKQKDISKVQTSEFDLPLVNAKNGDNGIMYYGRSSDFESAEMTIDIVNDGAVSTANVYPQPLKTGVLYNAYLIKPKFTPTRETLLFFTPCIYKAIKLKFSYENKASWNKVKNELISLPLKPTANTQTLEDIDFDFMETFIAELEQCRLAELQAYLKATGLENTTLSSDEENALNVFNNSWGGNTPCGLRWQSFKIVDIFEVKNTRNILARDVVKDSGTTPYLCASKENNAVNSYINYNADFLDKGNCIFIGGKTFVVTYQQKDFYSNDSHNLALYLKDTHSKTKLNQLFIITCIYKALNNKYSWGDSISNTKIQNDSILLPTNPHGKIDFNFMHTLINALMKQTIQGVAECCGTKIQATKEIISQETPVQKDSLF